MRLSINRTTLTVFLLMAAAAATHAPARVVAPAGGIVPLRPVPATRAASTQPVVADVASAQTVAAAPRAQSGPLRVAESTYDFGTIWDTQDVKHTFTMVNTGKEPVEIRNVRTTCGCTTTDKWDKTVAPGATWALPVTFSAAGRQGKNHKSVIVETGAPDQPRVVFNVTGEIKPLFAFEPGPHVSFGTLQEDSDETRSLTIINQGDEPVTLGEPEVNTDAVKVTLRAVKPGRQYELSVRTLPPITDSPRARIRVPTGLKTDPELIVYVYGYIRPRVAVLPATMLIPQPLERDFGRRLMIRVADGATVHVKDVKVSIDEVDARLETAKEGQLYYIWLKIPAGVQLPEGGATVTVTTDDEKVPQLKVPLRPFQSHSRTDVARPSRPTTQPARQAEE